MGTSRGDAFGVGVEHKGWERSHFEKDVTIVVLAVRLGAQVMLFEDQRSSWRSAWNLHLGVSSKNPNHPRQREIILRHRLPR